MHYRRLSLVLMIAATLGMAGQVCAQMPTPMGLTPEQELGRMLYMEMNLSINKNQACASCHHPEFGFRDPTTMPVSEGSIPGLVGDRNAPSAAYAAFSPFFRWDENEGLYMGGQFWDDRANTLADQAAGPPLNPVEMAMPNKWMAVDRLRTSAPNPAFSPPIAFKWKNYIDAFKEVYDIDLSQIPRYVPPRTSRGATVDRRPVPPGVLEVYDRMAKAIGELEKSRVFNQFTSKYDYYLAGKAVLTEQELSGLNLFNDDTTAKCVLCHLSQPAIAPDGNPLPPLFTDFTYDNLGIPVNPKVVKLREKAGLPVSTDYGLGGRPDIAARDPLKIKGGKVISEGQAGKHKVMSLRNIAVTAPYGHNGLFSSLEQIMHFYNTRDAKLDCNEPMGSDDKEFGTNCWPAPEVEMNVNTEELGDLGLDEQQEADIVAFLKTLTDGYKPDGKPAPSPWFKNYPPVLPVPMP